jgi:glycosyltransferase involved in cell wall biosynthesis
VANGTPENLEVIGDAAHSFPKNDFAALSTVIGELLADPTQCAELGERAKARALSIYSWDAVVSKYEALFAALTTKKQESK